MPVTKREQRGEREHGGVEANLAQPRRAARRDGHEPVDGPHAEQQAGDPAERREQQALGQQLADDAARPAPSATRTRELAAARRAARQQEVGDVRARDQQHEADRARAWRAGPA